MSKQTAVEFLSEQIWNFEQMLMDNGIDTFFMEVIEQAKEMEREQIENAWDRGQYIGMSFPQGFIDNNFEQDSEAYYNETYKGGEQ